jgi:hypothetical protein
MPSKREKSFTQVWRDSTWMTAQLVFNALVWENKWRLWGVSKKHNKSHETGEPEKTGVDWQMVEQ